MVEETRKDYWHWPVRILTWLVLLWLGYCVVMALMKRREVVGKINEAVDVCSKDPARAARLINEAKKEILVLRETPAERFLAMARMPFPSIDDQCASVYRALGDLYAKRFTHQPTIRAYSMCLLHNPMQKGIAIDLGSSCMKTDNLELGYYISILANAEKPGRGKIYERYFGKHYTPDWTGK